MEFKDLLKVLEEYYAKATEAQAVRKKWCNDEIRIKSGMVLTQCNSRENMTQLQDLITSELNYIFSIYREDDNFEIENVKNNINLFIESTNIWLECFEEKKGE
jgi:hypothetical protein